MERASPKATGAPPRPLASRARPFDPTAPLSLAFVLLLATLVLLPMFWLVVTSFRNDAGRFTLDQYRQFFTDASFLKPLVTTLWTSATVGVLCVAVAAPMGWLVARTDLPGKRLLRILILASFVTPPFLGAFAWVLLGGPNAGLINQWYYALFGLKAFEAAPLLNIFSAGGMVFVMMLYTFPYVFTFVANGLDQERVPLAALDRRRIRRLATSEEPGAFGFLRRVLAHRVNVIAHVAVALVDDRHAVRPHLRAAKVSVMRAGVFAVVELHVHHRGAFQTNLHFDDAVPGGDLQAVDGGVGGDGGFAIGGGDVLVAGLHTLQCALFEDEGVHDPVPGLRRRGALEVIGKKEFLLPGDGFGRDGG